ncbi:hypothetical protein [Campylobacter concisus]
MYLLEHTRCLTKYDKCEDINKILSEQIYSAKTTKFHKIAKFGSP